MPPSLRDLYHAHAVEPPGATSLSEPPATAVLSTSPTYARLPPLFRPSTASTMSAMSATSATSTASTTPSGYLRLPEINTLREPPAPLTGYVHRMAEPAALIRTPVSEAGSRSMERSAAAIAAHTAAAQRSVANSGQPKFVVMTGPAIDNSTTSSVTSSTTYEPAGSDARTPSRRGSQGRSASKRTTPRKPISSAAKAAAARAEMLANVSYTIDKADGTSMTFSRRNMSETFDISPAALQASQPRSIPPPPLPASVLQSPFRLPVSPAAMLRSMPTAMATAMPLDDPQESLVLPPIVNASPSSTASTDTPHIQTLLPVSEPGPRRSLWQAAPVRDRPAHMVFPLVVPARSASSPASPCRTASSYTPLPTMKRRSSLNLMSLPAALASLEPEGGSSEAEAKRFLLPDHEPRLKPQATTTRTSYGFQLETFQRTSRKQYQQQRHRMHQQRYRQRQQEQQQQKRQQQVQQHQEGRQRQWEVPLGQASVSPHQPQSQPQCQPQSSSSPAPQIPSHQPQNQSQPQSQPQPQPQLPDQPQLTHHPSTPESPLLYRRSALPPQVLGGEVSLDDMPRVHVVQVPGQSFPAPLPRGNVPGFLLLPAEKDAADWLVGKGGTGGDLWEDSLSSGTCAGITYPLVSEAEARKVNGEVSAVAAAAGNHDGIPANLLCRAMDGTGDARLTRSALRTLRRLACPAAAQLLPIHEYEYEVTARSIALAICILVRPPVAEGEEGSTPSHALDLCQLHSTEAGETDCPTTPLLVGGRALMPAIVGSRLAAEVATDTLGPGQSLEVPRLTIILSSDWSTWTASCVAVDMPAGSCVQTHGDQPQPEHFDPRIPPGSRLRLVQRGTCRHRHVDAGTRVQRRLVLTRVARGMQANLVVEERVFLLTGTDDGEATGQPRGVLVVFSTAYFLQASKR